MLHTCSYKTAKILHRWYFPSNVQGTASPSLSQSTFSLRIATLLRGSPILHHLWELSSFLYFPVLILARVIFHRYSPRWDIEKHYDRARSLRLNYRAKSEAQNARCEPKPRPTATRNPTKRSRDCNPLVEFLSLAGRLVSVMGLGWTNKTASIQAWSRRMTSSTVRQLRLLAVSTQAISWLTRQTMSWDIRNDIDRSQEPSHDPLVFGLNASSFFTISKSRDRFLSWFGPVGFHRVRFALLDSFEINTKSTTSISVVHHGLSGLKHC